MADGNQSERITRGHARRFVRSGTIHARFAYANVFSDCWPPSSDRGHLYVVSMNIAACKFSPLELALPSALFLLFLLGHPGFSPEGRRTVSITRVNYSRIAAQRRLNLSALDEN